MILEEGKKCNKCGEIKSITCFSPEKKAKSGLKNDCKSCRNKINETWRDNNKEYYKQVSKFRTRVRKVGTNLYDGYISTYLRRQNIPITSETIELKREILKLKRLAK